MKTGKIRKFLQGTLRSYTKKEGSENAKTEKCILCGKDTGIPFSMPIDDRKYFINGCGQLCEDCFEELEYLSISENKISDDDMEILLEMTRKNGKENVYEQGI